MRARALKTNFVINVIGALIPLVVSLITVPIYVRHIGDARYGVLSIVWVLLGYLGFLDFGLSRAAANSLARLKHAPQADRARVLVTTLTLNLGLGLLGSVVLAVVGSYLLQHVLAVPEALKPEVARAFPWIVALFPLALVGGVGNGAIESRENFLLSNLIGVGGTAIGQIVPVLLAVVVGPSLAVVVPAAAVIRAMTVLLVLAVVWRYEGPLSPQQFDRSQARRLLGYGGWLTVSGIISPLLVSIDQFVIGSVVNVTAVTHYVVPMNLVTRSQMFPGALVRTLFPRLSASSPDEARQLASRALTTMSYGYATLCAPAMVLTPVFFRFWIGADFGAIATPIAEILFLGAWINSLAFVPYELLQTQGRPDITGKFHAAEVIPFVAILWVLTSAFGILGAAAAWSLRCVIDALCLFGASRMPKRDLARAAIPFTLLITGAILARMLGADPWRAGPAAVILGFGSMALSLAMASDLRQFATALPMRLMGAALPKRAAPAKL